VELRLGEKEKGKSREERDRNDRDGCGR